MSDVKWIKITTTMFDDEKIRLIEAMPEKDTILVIWIKLLTLCGRCNQEGRIILSGDIAYNEEMLASLFNRPVSSLRLAVDVFKSFKMIELEQGIIEISNWHKHQNMEGLEKIKEQNRLRQLDFRNRKKNKSKNKRSALPVTLRNVTFDFEELWNIYPNKLGKKEAYRHFKASVLTDKDFQDITIALDNYIKKARTLEPQYIKHGSSWFNNWKDWISYNDNILNKKVRTPDLNCFMCKGTGKMGGGSECGCGTVK